MYCIPRESYLPTTFEVYHHNSISVLFRFMLDCDWLWIDLIAIISLINLFDH